nr:uncharacterized protein LOC121470250 isoform X1 [Taeniopygia guttata]
MGSAGSEVRGHHPPPQMLLTAVFLSAVATNRLDPGNLWPCPPETGQGAGPEPEEGGAGASFGALLGLSLPSASGVLWGCSHCAELRDIARSVLAGSLGAATATALGSRRCCWVPAWRGSCCGTSSEPPWAVLGSRCRRLARSRALPLPRALSRGRLWLLVATVTTAALGVLLGSLDLLAPVLSLCVSPPGDLQVTSRPSGCA